MTTAALAASSAIPSAFGQDSGATRSVADRFAAALSAHDIAAFAALFAEDYVNHQMSAAAPRSPPGEPSKRLTVDFFAARLAGIPDLQVVVEAALAAPFGVAASFVYTGTHSGPLMGVAPTGRHLRFTSCDIFRVSGGRIVEHWGMGDIAGVLAQIRS